MNNSRLLAAIRFRCQDSANALAVYLGVMLLLYAAMVGMLNGIFDHDQTQISGGSEFSIVIMFFVLGIVCIREDLRHFSQYGLTRRSVFLCDLTAHTLAAIVGCLLNSLLLQGVVLLAGGSIVTLTSLFTLPVFSLWYVSAGCSIVLCLCMAMLGQLISLLYYRLSKRDSLLLTFGGGALLLVGLPWLISRLVLLEPLRKACAMFISWLFAAPLHFIASFLLLGLLFAALSWLLIRRAPVK